MFVGGGSSEAYDAWSAADDVTGYENLGGARHMFANRLSYYFDFKGSYTSRRFTIATTTTTTTTTITGTFLQAGCHSCNRV